MTIEFGRRSLLKAGLASGVLLAFHIPVRAANEPNQPVDTDGAFAPNAFIRIGRDDVERRAEWAAGTTVAVAA